jgi:CDP-diacylglycerol--glycerol-3-phosphate 3-phosphatidyltransferase
MRITANQVTLSRLLLMPVVGAMLYGGTTAHWVALILGGIVAMTDFVDGYLARRQGPTVLGGLMDPIADKVYVAVCFLPFADLHWVSWWFVIAIFLREFGVTAIRSSFEVRARNLPASYLARVKTWVQMFAAGYVLFVSLQPSRLLLACTLAAGAVGALLGGVVFRLVARRSWRGAWIFFGSFTGFFLAHWFWGADQFLWLLLLAAVVITCVSGLDYLVIAAREFGRERTLRAFDVVRLAGAAALPVLAALSMSIAHPRPWLVIAIIAIELAHGGLDNLLAHHGAAAPAWEWGARVFPVSLLLAGSVVLPGAADLWAAAALAVSLGGTAVTFWRKRRYYLEEGLRDKKKSAGPMPAASAAL